MFIILNWKEIANFAENKYKIVYEYIDTKVG